MDKVCSKCRAVKFLEDFHKDKNKQDGKSSVCKICARQKANSWRENNYLKAREADRQKRFRNHHITEEIFLNILKSQGDVCAICKTSVSVFSIDHDHGCCPGEWSCGKCIRGIICKPCNVGLGHFKDSVSMVYNALTYLEESKPECLTLWPPACRLAIPRPR